MSKTVFNISSWSCESCGFTQDFDPADAELMAKHHGGCTGCYACHIGHNPELKKKECKMVRDPVSKTKVTVMGEEELEDEEVYGKDGKKRKLTAAEKTKRKKEIQDAVSYWTDKLS